MRAQVKTYSNDCHPIQAAEWTKYAAAVELEMTDLMVADPIRIPGTPNLMCHRLPRLVNCVGLEIGTVTLKRRTEFRVCAASGILYSKEGKGRFS
jgi:hypothetical protein